MEYSVSSTKSVNLHMHWYSCFSYRVDELIESFLYRRHESSLVLPESLPFYDQKHFFANRSGMTKMFLANNEGSTFVQSPNGYVDSGQCGNSSDKARTPPRRRSLVTSHFHHPAFLGRRLPVTLLHACPAFCVLKLAASRTLK